MRVFWIVLKVIVSIIVIKLLFVAAVVGAALFFVH